MLCRRVIFVLLSAGPVVHAADVTALTIEGRTFQGEWVGIHGGAVQLDEGTSRLNLPTSDLMSLRWPKPTTQPSTAFETIAYLDDGSRLHVRIQSGDAKHVELSAPHVGVFRIPLSALAALRFSNGPGDRAQEVFDQAMEKPDPTRDTLIMVRENRVRVLRGITESITPAGGIFRWRDRPVPIEPTTVFGLVLATGISSASQPASQCILHNGAIYAGQVTSGDREQIVLAMTTGDSASVPVRLISEIRFRSDRVLFLDELKPASYESQSFSLMKWPYHFNRSVANRPLTIGTKTFQRGIGMRSAAKLSFDLPDGFNRLAATIGIDEGVGDLGNTVFRIVAGEQEVFHSGPVTGADKPRDILVPLNGAKRIQLIVEFGEDLDIGDHANWANIRVIQ